MGKRNKGRSGRPSRPSARPARPAGSPKRRWWNHANKTILWAGGVATAITAVLTLVLSLLPKHSPQNVARFISVHPLGSLPLSEYQQRSAVFKLRSAGNLQGHGPSLVVAIAGQSSPTSVQDGAATSPTSSPSPTITTSSPSPTITTSSPSPTITTSSPSPTITTSSPSPTITTSSPSANCTASSTGSLSPSRAPSANCAASSTAAASQSATGSQTGTASPASGIKSLPPLGMSFNGFSAYVNRVAGLVQKLDPGFDLNCGGRPCYVYMQEWCTDYRKGIRLNNASDCAKDIVAGVGSSQLTGGQGSGQSGGQGSGQSGGQGSGQSGGQGSGQSGGQGSGQSGGQGSGDSTKRQPLGELISVDLELAGLQGQPVFLSWSIFQKDGPGQLSGRWLNSFVAFRLEATTNDDSGTLEMWIPLPKPKEPYFIRLALTTGSASLASTDSDPFE